MFLIILGASLTLGTALLAVVSLTDGALVASRTAAQVIGWLFVVATLVGLAGLRRASPGQICAVGVTLCSGLVVLYMSYFFEWTRLPPATVTHAAAELSVGSPTQKGVDLWPTGASLTLASMQVMQPAGVQEAAKGTSPRRKLAPAALQAAPAAAACSALTGVESLQCDRCSDKTAFAWMACQETVRLEYCDSEAGEEAICPAPFPLSHPG